MSRAVADLPRAAHVSGATGREAYRTLHRHPKNRLAGSSANRERKRVGCYFTLGQRPLADARGFVLNPQ
jgi:hypothetical protein